jgi:hypothetical protein
VGLFDGIREHRIKSAGIQFQYSENKRVQEYNSSTAGK